MEKELIDGYTLFWSGNRRSRNGVAFIISKSVSYTVQEVEYVSERIIRTVLSNKGVSLKILAVYAPQLGCTKEKKDVFEATLENSLRGAHVVLGDLNAKVGKEKRW